MITDCREQAVGSPPGEEGLVRDATSRCDDPLKRRLRDDLATVFAAGRRAFEADPDITGKQLYAEVERLAAEAGWELGGWHIGHLVGEFPPEYNDWEDVDSHIVPANDKPLRRMDEAGQLLHWILEIHLIDSGRGYGGFYEELLDL